MTIVEVMLGIALGGLLLVSATALLGQIEAANTILGRVARTEDTRANATRILYALLTRVDVRPDSLGRFTADATSAHFRTHCEVPGGWLEPCDVSVSLDAQHDSSAVIGQLSTGEVLTLGTWLGQGEFRYLEVSPSGDKWLAQWGRSIVPPAAMALVLATDTIMLPVAGR
ncbi:MAG: hypothetical protein ABIY52_04820 [Gemmatimonadaceae bacterium]